MQIVIVLLILSFVGNVHGLIMPRLNRVCKRTSLNSHQGFFDASWSILTAIETKPDDYVYGAVAAPDFVLPLGAVLVVLSAAIPFLLKPGEEALEQQRENENITNNQFNKRKDKDLR